MSKGIFYLVYTSIASSLMGEEDLLLLLNQSRIHNSAVGMTGMLLYMEGKFITRTQGRFIQVLEGQKDHVLLLYNSICRDKRNFSVLMLGSGFNINRCFPKWAMGFRSFDVRTCENIEGCFDIESVLSNLESQHNADGITNFLRSFYLINKEQ